MMKKKLVAFVFLFFIIVYSTSAAAEQELDQILEYVKTEVGNYTMYPKNGWWQIENNIKEKHNIIIKDYILSAAQKYYIRLIIDKNSNVKNFRTFEQKKIFPKNLLEYSRDYFSLSKNQRAKERAKERNKEKKSNKTSAEKIKNADRRENSNDNEDYSYINTAEVNSYKISSPHIIQSSPDTSMLFAGEKKLTIEGLNRQMKQFDSYIINDISKIQEKDDFDGKVQKYKSQLKKIQEEEETAEPSFTITKTDPRVFNTPELKAADNLLTDINRSLGKNSYNNLDERAAKTMSEPLDKNLNNPIQRLESADMTLLKNDLDNALNHMSMLNDSIKGFLKNVDIRSDARFQAMTKENKNLEIQLDNANKLVISLKDQFIKKIEDTNKKNESLVKKNQNLSDNLLELSDILKDYQNQNLELTELLRQSVSEIDRLRATNKNLIIKMNVELEELRRENKVLKDRLEIQTKSITAPTTNFNIDFNNQNKPK